MIRRVMPRIIVQDIFGVSPMKAPSPLPMLGKFRVKFSYVITARTAVPVELYRTFLRLYNKRKTQCDDDFAKANYYGSTINSVDVPEAVDWCKDQFGTYGFCFNSITYRFWFATEQQQSMFVLVWG